MRTHRRLRLNAWVLAALLLGAWSLAQLAGEGRAAASTTPQAQERVVPLAAAATVQRQGIQGGWALDDAGQVDFPHSLLAQLPLIQESGAEWVRINFRLGTAYRSWTAPGPDGSTALERYDLVVDEARAGGLRILGLLSNDTWVGGQEEWTAGAAELGRGNGDNAYVRAFSQQAAVVLARHFRGRIDTWEVWNEPNAWRTNPRPGVYEGETFLYPSNFAWLLRRVYEGTRAAGLPGLTLVSGGVMGSNYGGYGVPQPGDYRTAAEGEVFAGVASAATFPTEVPYPTRTPTATPGPTATPTAVPSSEPGADPEPPAAPATAPTPPAATGVRPAAPQAGVSSGARYLRATYEEGLARAGWAEVRQRYGSYPVDAVGQHLYLNQGGTVPATVLRAFLEDLRAAYEPFEGVDTPKRTAITEFGWTTPGVSEAVQAANLQSAYAVFRSVPYVGIAYWFSVQDVPEGGISFGLQTGGEPADSYRGTPKPAFRAYQAAAGARAPAPPLATPSAADGPGQAAQRVAVQVREDAVSVTIPGRERPVVVAAGTVPRESGGPEDACPRDWTHRGYLRLDHSAAGGAAIGGAVYGVAAGGLLDWIPPEEAACVDWSRIGPEASVPAQALLQLRLLRLRPLALLWVLDGDEFWNGRLYEVDAGGRARLVTLATWEDQPSRYQALWPNVTPVSWSSIYELHQLGMVGPDV